MSESASAFWRFSLRFYRRPEVPDVCLALQDQHSVDVNLLFFILFLAVSGRRIAADEMRKMDSCVRNWRTCVVQPLRAIRRDLKSGIAPLDAQAAAALRSAIKRDELEAEHLQQISLEREFPVESTGSSAQPRAAAYANIAAYGKTFGLLPQTVINSLLQSLADEFLA